MHIPECIDLLIQELKQPHRKELPILDHGLFGWARCLGSPWFRHTEGIPEVVIHRIVCLPLSLRWLYPLNEALFLQYNTINKYKIRVWFEKNAEKNLPSSSP